MSLKYKCQGCRSGIESEEKEYDIHSNGYSCSCDEHYKIDDKKKRKYY